VSIYKNHSRCIWRVFIPVLKQIPDLGNQETTRVVELCRTTLISKLVNLFDFTRTSAELERRSVLILGLGPMSQPSGHGQDAKGVLRRLRTLPYTTQTGHNFTPITLQASA
jgi:hypothetical protein